MKAPGEKLIIRLWETVEKAGVGFLAPWQIRRVEKARREARLASAQMERDIKDIRSGRKFLTADGQIVKTTNLGIGHPSENDRKPVAIASAAQSNLFLREMRGDVNVGKALSAAETELETDAQEPPDRRVEEDWLFRWRNSASQVSAAELQSLWGRVLAGEIKSPGTFSLRTLEFLGNLSREEASQIAKLAPFVIDNDFVFKGNNSLLEAEGITVGFLLSLQDLGIVDPSKRQRRIGWNPATPNKQFRVYFFAYNRVLIITHDNPKSEFFLEVHRLTLLGKEVMKLGVFTPHEGYVRQIGHTIRDRGFKVELAKYQQITETEWGYFDAEVL